MITHENVVVKNDKTGYSDYQKSIKALKTKFSFVAPELFDAIGDIQESASDSVHEGSWEAWDSSKLTVLIELTKAILHEMYVVPEERKGRLGVLNQIKSAFSNSKNKDTELVEEKSE